MSAPSPMCGTRILVLTLAAMMAAAAYADPGTPAHPHRKAASARAYAAPAASTPHARAGSRTRPRSATPRTGPKTARAAAMHMAHPVSKLRAAKAPGMRRHGPARESAKPTQGCGAQKAVKPAQHDDPAPSPPIPPPTQTAGEAPATQMADVAPALAPDTPRALTRQTSLRTARGGTPPPLRGSEAVLERQNDRLEADGLERIENEDDLAARIQNHLLVPVPASSALTVNQDLPVNHRYCRPWTAQFLKDLARAHQAAYHRPLEVSSAVRPASYQERLERTNGNAAPAEGDIVSPHIMGATVDIAKSGLTAKEIGWMRIRLLALETAGKIDVEEEFQQSCFHITVYKAYAPLRASHTRARVAPLVSQAAGQ